MSGYQQSNQYGQPNSQIGYMQAPPAYAQQQPQSAYPPQPQYQQSYGGGGGYPPQPSYVVAQPQAQNTVVVLGNARSGEYAHGLCGCCEDCNACMYGFCCPCVVVGQASGQARGTGFNTCRCLCSLVCGPCAINRTRTEVQIARGIPVRFCANCCVAHCLGFCALIQDYRESNLIAGGDREVLIVHK